MIKQVQLRGISRSPSDRMIADGGCAESLNVQIEEQEIVQMLAPRDVTSAKTGGGTLGMNEPVLIHKAQGMENYILVSKGADHFIRIAKADGIIEDFEVPLNNETFVSAVADGNMVIVSTDKHSHYIFLKEGEYIYLGTRVPKPVVKFTNSSSSAAVINLKSSDFTSLAAKELFTQLSAVAPATWKSKFDAIARNYDVYNSSSSGYSDRDMIDGLRNEMWQAVSNRMNLERNGDKACFPFLIRYALKLYDGTYMYQSEPEIIGDGNQGAEFSILRLNSETYLRIVLPSIRSVSYSVKAGDISKWSDIVQSVVVAVTPDISNPAINSRAISSENADNGISLVLDGMSGLSVAKDFESKLLDASLFYKVDEMSVEDIPDTGYSESRNVKIYGKDELVVKERISDDDFSHAEIIPASAVMQYNARLIFSGFTSYLCGGDPFFRMDYSSTSCTIKYFVRNTDGSVSTVFGRNENGGTSFNHCPDTWLYYPDARCFKVQIKRGDNVYEVGMKPHPNLNGAYAFSGFGLSEVDFTRGKTPVTATDFDTELPYSKDERKIAMSMAGNPFLFPAIGRRTFTDAIIKCATTTRALSEGQFGRYPVMVFTKGGIWAASIENTGEFGSIVPVSREVAVSADCITPIDNAIVFVSEEGVKLMQGSDISDISENMKGRHFCLEGDDDVNGVALNAIKMCDTFRYFDGSLTDDTPFMSFMKRSLCAYDNKAQRLIFFDNGNPMDYHYVYRLGTQTWHKMDLRSVKDADGNTLFNSFTVVGTLNSYPDILVSGKRKKRVGSLVNELYGIFDFGTILDVAEEQPVLPGIIITRAMDFDNDNVRKAIKEIKLRGHYAKGNVKYILMASNDGLRYRVINSLKGCTYNLFRLVILLNMTADERFSYIDIDYDTRFTDKLR